jgi:outer membrane immunogenic protein
MKMKTAIAAAAALLASSTLASAADMAVKARPMVAPAPVWTWTGFYIGAHVGAGWGETESTITGFSVPAIPAAINGLAIPFSQNSRSGFLGGVQAGYNWQAGWAVFGVQGDFAGADIKGSNPCLLLLNCTSTTDWLATASARLGAVVLDRGLVYVKGGGAWMNTTHSVRLPGFGTALGGGAAAFSNLEIANRESTAWGWMVGFGTEWQITPNWSAFVEYNYIEFDKKNEAFLLNLGPANALVPGGITVNADLKNTLSVAKVGVNYKFDWGTPVVARY